MTWGRGKDALNITGEANPSRAAECICVSSSAWLGLVSGSCPVEMPPEAPPDQLVAIPQFFLLRCSKPRQSELMLGIR